MRVLVTGSSGFIGFHLSKKLLSKGHQVVGVDNHNSHYDEKLKEYRNSILSEFSNFKFKSGDINKINDFLDPDLKFDLAVNLAAQAGVRVKKEKEHLYNETNVKGFENFCIFCKNRNIKSVIYASSSSVYSDKGGGKFSEDLTPLEPKSIYGLTKLQNELFAQSFSKKYQISMIGLRFFSVFGPMGRPDMAYYAFAESLLNNSVIYLNNKGKMRRDMTYIDDIVDGIMSSINLVMREHQNNEIFNLGNDKPIETLAMLETIEKKINKKASIKNVKTDNESIYTHSDNKKAEIILGYNPKITFDNGIENFLNWYLKYEKY
tara:strand:- start:905 stop:1861 length:957 start_codon:yes stop_codon:yes gene_type:complete